MPSAPRPPPVSKSASTVPDAFSPRLRRPPRSPRVGEVLSLTGFWRLRGFSKRMGNLFLGEDPAYHRATQGEIRQSCELDRLVYIGLVVGYDTA